MFATVFRILNLPTHLPVLLHSSGLISKARIYDWGWDSHFEASSFSLVVAYGSISSHLVCDTKTNLILCMGIFGGWLLLLHDLAALFISEVDGVIAGCDVVGFAALRRQWADRALGTRSSLTLAVGLKMRLAESRVTHTPIDCVQDGHQGMFTVACNNVHIREAHAERHMHCLGDAHWYAWFHAL